MTHKMKDTMKDWFTRIFKRKKPKPLTEELATEKPSRAYTERMDKLVKQRNELAEELKKIRREKAGLDGYDFYAYDLFKHPEKLAELERSMPYYSGYVVSSTIVEKMAFTRDFFGNLCEKKMKVETPTLSYCEGFEETLGRLEYSKGAEIYKKETILEYGLEILDLKIAYLRRCLNLTMKHLSDYRDENGDNRLRLRLIDSGWNNFSPLAITTSERGVSSVNILATGTCELKEICMNGIPSISDILHMAADPEVKEWAIELLRESPKFDVQIRGITSALQIDGIDRITRAKLGPTGQRDLEYRVVDDLLEEIAYYSNANLRLKAVEALIYRTFALHRIQLEARLVTIAIHNPDTEIRSLIISALSSNKKTVMLKEVMDRTGFADSCQFAKEKLKELEQPISSCG